MRFSLPRRSLILSILDAGARRAYPNASGKQWEAENGGQPLVYTKLATAFGHLAFRRRFARPVPITSLSAISSLAFRITYGLRPPEPLDRRSIMKPREVIHSAI
jgi:hypothetical protein